MTDEKTSNKDVKQAMTLEELEIVEKQLRERNATQPCPRCKNEKFLTLRDITSLQYQDLKYKDSKTIIPSFITVCTKCGFISLHAIGALEFMKEGVIKIE